MAIISLSPITKRNEVVRTETETKLDQLTKLWAAVESKILAMQPPRHMEYMFKEETGQDYDTNYYLGLQRHGGKWRLCYGSIEEINQEERIDWRPINDCSTEVRVDAANHIDGLMEEVVKSGKEYLPEIDKAIESLEDALKDTY